MKNIVPLASNQHCMHGRIINTWPGSMQENNGVFVGCNFLDQSKCCFFSMYGLLSSLEPNHNVAVWVCRSNMTRAQVIFQQTVQNPFLGTGHLHVKSTNMSNLNIANCNRQLLNPPQVVVGRLKPQECANSKARYLTGKEANLDHRNRIFLERSNRIMSDQKQYFLEFKGKKSFLGAFSILALWGQTVVRSFRQRFFAPNVFAIFHFIFGSFPFLRYLRRCGIKF